MASIARESQRQWGTEQQAKYIGELNRRIGSLAERPQSGQAYGPGRPGLRRLHVGSHVVFYRFDDVAVLVVRVLHQRMDLERRLGPNA